jgi:hypothetical protein
VSRSTQAQRTRDWWYSSGHLYEVYFQPIYLGAPGDDPPLGMLALGQEINRDVAAEVAHVADSQVVFYFGDAIIAATISAREEDALEKLGSHTVRYGWSGRIFWPPQWTWPRKRPNRCGWWC